MLSKILHFVKDNKSEIILFLCVVLISLFSFAFGYIIGRTQEKPYLEFHEIINDKSEE